MAAQANVNYAELTDEQIIAIKKRIETFAKTNELFGDLYNYEKWDRGTKTMKSRKVVKPKVAKEEVTVAIENVAPRSQKIAVETFQRSVDVYRDKISYTAEDVLFGFDDIVKIAGDTLAEITTQKLNWIKSAPLFKSACTIDPVEVSGADNYLKTLAKAAIVLQKNEAKPWSRGKYLALVTPESIELIREEIEAKGASMSEPMKEEVETGIVGGYGRWLFKECSHDSMYDATNSGDVNMVLLGLRPNGMKPFDCAKIDGTEIIHNPLGSGVLVDADGNYTSDDNKQVGSIAVNVNGIGAFVNDDLCILDCEIAATEIAKSELNEGDKAGFVSMSPIYVRPYDDEIDGAVFTKVATDLYTKIIVDDANKKITGSLKKLAAWAEAGYEESNKHYLPLHIAGEGVLKVKLGSGEEKTLDADGIYITMVDTSRKAMKLVVNQYINDKLVGSRTYALTGLTLAD